MTEANAVKSVVVGLSADLTLHFEMRINRLVQLLIGPYSFISKADAQFSGVLVPCGTDYVPKNSVFHHFLEME